MTLKLSNYPQNDDALTNNSLTKYIRNQRRYIFETYEPSSTKKMDLVLEYNKHVLPSIK